jgi:hypothetical protein
MNVNKYQVEDVLDKSLSTNDVIVLSSRTNCVYK